MMQAIVLDGPPYPDPHVTLPLVREENLVTGVPELTRQLGPLTSLETDLLTLAAAIFALDLAAVRGEREDIARDLYLTVPVVNHAAFIHHADDLANILYTLSCDNWTIEFARRPGVPENATAWPERAGKTLLFSGGLDSLAAAVEEIEAGTHLQLASHYTGNPITRACQKRLHTYLEGIAGGSVPRVSVKAGGRNRGALAFPDDKAREPTQRTRSFLFLVIGAIAARRSGHHEVLMIAENGQMAIHLPLTAARIGAFSTHTAHPEFVDAMQSFLSALLSFQLTVHNPFLYRTKGECVGHLVAVHTLAVADSVSCWKSARQAHSHCLKEAKWTYQDLETASGVSTDTISHIVNGVVRAKRGPGRGPTRATLTKLIVALATRFDDLVTDEETRLSREEADERKEWTHSLLTAPPRDAAGHARPAHRPAAPHTAGRPHA